MIAPCILLMLLLLAFPHHNTFAQKVMPLYAHKIPNSIKSVNKEYADVNQTLFNVSVPTLTMYLPAQDPGKRTAVIICPGGGYGSLVIQKEGYDIAKYFADHGIAAFVLKYRLPSDSTMIDKSIGPLQDVQTAIKLVKEHSAQWHIDTTFVGVMGFSAGGHLAATASTWFDKPVVKGGKISLRPAFSILIYPVISMTDSLMHKGSRDNLLGTHPSKEKIEQFSNELLVTDKTPPALIMYAADDSLVPIGNSIAYATVVQQNNIAMCIDRYPNGGHGFVLNLNKDLWLMECIKWIDKIKNNKLLFQ